MLTGSSQLTRGTLGGSDIRAGLCRFIPACAGNSYERKKVTEYTSVHPRLRGELGSKERQSPRPGGSSPLTRGTHRLTPDAQRDRRFIPAYAGNSFLFPSVGRLPTVHPRLRGELSNFAVFGEFNFGSSPLTRGTRCKRPVVHQPARFIPAYAGNSSERFRSRSGNTVHPRLRGELT